MKFALILIATLNFCFVEANSGTLETFGFRREKIEKFLNETRITTIRPVSFENFFEKIKPFMTDAEKAAWSKVISPYLKHQVPRMEAKIENVGNNNAVVELKVTAGNESIRIKLLNKKDAAFLFNDKEVLYSDLSQDGGRNRMLSALPPSVAISIDQVWKNEAPKPPDKSISKTDKKKSAPNKVTPKKSGGWLFSGRKDASGSQFNALALATLASVSGLIYLSDDKSFERKNILAPVALK